MLSYNTVFASIGKICYHNSYNMDRYSGIEFNFNRSPRKNWALKQRRKYQAGLLLETGEWTKGVNASDLWSLVTSCCSFATVLDFSDLNVLLCMAGLFFC